MLRPDQRAGLRPRSSDDGGVRWPRAAATTSARWHRTGAKGEDFELKYILKSFYFGIGVRKDSPELLQWLNTFIFTLKSDGTLEALSQKHRATPAASAPGLLTGAERSGAARFASRVPTRPLCEVSRQVSWITPSTSDRLRTSWPLLLWGLGARWSSRCLSMIFGLAIGIPRRDRQELRAAAGQGGGERLCRADPQHPAADPALLHLLHPAFRRPSGPERYRRGRRALDPPRRLRHRDRAGGHRVPFRRARSRPAASLGLGPADHPLSS